MFPFGKYSIFINLIFNFIFTILYIFQRKFINKLKKDPHSDLFINTPLTIKITASNAIKYLIKPLKLSIIAGISNNIPKNKLK